jgi:hypothetical protein
VALCCWWWWGAPRTPGDEDRAAAYAAKLREAEKALAAGELTEARAKLADCDPALRGWEWYALGALADGAPPARPLTPMKEAGQAVLSGDGRVAAVLFKPGDENASLHAFDLTVGKRLMRFPPEGVDDKFWGERVALSADGRLLGTSSGDQYAPRRIPWHTVITGREAMGNVGSRLRGIDEWVRLEKIDGQWVEAERHVEREGFALGLDLRAQLPLTDGEAHGSHGPIALGGPKRLYSASGESLSPADWGGQNHPGGEVTSLDLSPDEKLLAVGRGNGVLQLLDAGTGVERLRVSAAEKAEAVTRVRFSPDCQLLAVSDAGGVTVRDTAGGKLLARIAGTHTATAFAPDGRLLLASADAVAVYEPRSGLRLCGLPGLADRVADLACRADGTLVVLGAIGLDLAARELGLGDPDEKWLTAAIEDAGRDAASRAHLLRRRSETHTRCGDFAEAKRDLEAAHALDPAATIERVAEHEPKPPVRADPPITAPLHGIQASDQYMIESALKSGMVLDVKDARAEDYTPIQLAGPGNQENRRWRLISLGGDEYLIESALKKGMVLDVKDARAEQGAPIQLGGEGDQPRGQGTNRRWKLVPTGGDGEYRIESALKEGLVLEVKDGKAENDTPIQVGDAGQEAKQRWKLVRVEPADTGQK